MRMIDKRVLLINMPFSSIFRPALGISLLKGALAREGITTDLQYLNILLAEFMGLDCYSLVSQDTRNLVTQEDSQPTNTTHKLSSAGYESQFSTKQEWLEDDRLTGDWLFSQYFYGNGSLNAERYIKRYLNSATTNISDHLLHKLIATRERIPSYLDACFRSIDWRNYFLVGFTTTFQQNLASFSFARLLKLHFPDLLIAFGGANCEGVMGEEILRQFPFIDFVALGEADHSFPQLVNSLRKGGTAEGIPGIAWRKNNCCYNNGPAVPVQNLDTLPYPIFDDYFEQFHASPVSHGERPILLMETSRGCWWGERSPCTFCALNGTHMRYRLKNAQRAFEEIRYLTRRHDTSTIVMVDNIMPLDYFNTLLPQLAAQEQRLSIFFETKANLKKRQVRQLRQAGVTLLQPGIESLSTPILKLMGKGTTALKNVALLKWCQTFGVKPAWMLLYGFPGENPADYDSTLAILKRITHLTEGDISPVQVQRFSPYFNAPAKYGIKGIRPLHTYKYVYPFDADVVSRLCYFFDFDFADGRNPSTYTQAVVEFMRQWAYEPIEKCTLIHKRRDNGHAVIHDTRSNRALDNLELDAIQNAIYEYCDCPRSVSRIKEHLEATFLGYKYDRANIKDFLDYLEEVYLMIKETDVYLSVAIMGSDLEEHTHAETILPVEDINRHNWDWATNSNHSSRSV